MRRKDTSIPGYTPRSDKSQSWRWSVHLKMLDAGMAKEAMEFVDCEDPETFHAVKVCAENPEHYARGVCDTCHSRICPECAWRESARLVRRYHEVIENAVKNGPKHYALRHITLTTQFTLYDRNARENLKAAKRKVNAWLDRVLGKGWHKTGQGVIVGSEFGPKGKKLHFHVLHYGRYIQQAIGSQVWEELTGNAVVDIRRADHEQGLRYMVKYVSKMEQLDPSDAVLLLTIIKGTRRVWTRGIFFKVKGGEAVRVCPDCGAEIVRWSVGQWRNYERQLYLRFGNNSASRESPECRQLSFEGEQWEANQTFGT